MFHHELYQTQKAKLIKYHLLIWWYFMCMLSFTFLLMYTVHLFILVLIGKHVFFLFWLS